MKQEDDPYQKCPVYDTENFNFRLVKEEDAGDLLECYSDSASAPIFNSDNCINNFVYKSLTEMKEPNSYYEPEDRGV